MKLTIIIPVYNELNTIEKIVNKVLVQNYIDKEIIIPLNIYFSKIT